MDAASNIVQVLVALLATLGIVILCAYLAKKLLSGTNGSGGLIKVLATKTLGSRERLMLVELEGHTMLIGVTQHNISKIHGFEGRLELETVAPSDFGTSLRTWMELK